MAGSAGWRAVALAVAIASSLLVLLAASPAGAVVRERVRVSLPDPGQLSAARLQFKVKGDKTPKLKLKLRNARDLPDSLIGAAQMTRSTEKKGRAVAFLSFANVPTTSSRISPRVIDEEALVEVRSAETGSRISDIEFQNIPGASRNFASILGLEPGVERQQAQETFGISDSEVPDDEFGRFDFDEFLELVDVNRVKETKVITSSTFQDDLQDLYRQWGISSAIAAAIGPPAVLDAEFVELVTGRAAPFVVNSSFGPSPSSPRVYFSAVEYSIPVWGAQLSQAGEIDLLEGPDARCQNGFLDEGLITRGIGPLGRFGASYRLECAFNRDDPRVFFDVPLEEEPPPGSDIFLFLPYPDYGSMGIGEAVGGEETTVRVRIDPF